MVKSVLGGLVRHLLTAGAGVFALAATVDAQTWQDVIVNANAIAGGVMFFVGLGASVYNKMK